jgi:membrane protease YdiL (CAAX protease family)
LGTLILATLRLHAQIVRRNRPAVACVCAVLAVLLSMGAYHRGKQLAGYLLAVWLGAFLTDLVVGLFPEDGAGFPIKHSKVKEALAVCGFTCLAVVPLTIRFSRLWPLPNPLTRLGFAAGLFLFTFFAGMACYFLFVYRYRPSELGVNVHYWYLPIAIHVVFGGITFLVAPEKSHWQSWIASNGLWSVVTTGVLQAALPEEFMRMMLQTRLASVFNNKGLGLFAASFLWACLHIPIFWSESPGWGFWRAAISTWTIIPIGLLWGYMTFRTKSLLPAVLVHGFNLWGLQNL